MKEEAWAICFNLNSYKCSVANPSKTPSGISKKSNFPDKSPPDVEHEQTSITILFIDTLIVVTELLQSFLT